MAQAPQQRQQGNRNLDSYVGVHTRVELFRQEHPTARLTTVVIKDDPLTVRCEIYLDGNESGIPNSSGMADEQGGMGGRGNSTLEKVETAAVGRALAFLGYEIREGIASREEMQRAERQPGPRPVSRPEDVPGVSKGMPPKQDAAAVRDADIMTALEILGKSEDGLNEWVGKKWPQMKGADWSDLGPSYKHDILLHLNGLVNKKATGK